MCVAAGVGVALPRLSLLKILLRSIINVDKSLRVLDSKDWGREQILQPTTHQKAVGRLEFLKLNYSAKPLRQTM